MACQSRPARQQHTQRFGVTLRRRVIAAGFAAGVAVAAAVAGAQSPDAESRPGTEQTAETGAEQMPERSREDLNTAADAQVQHSPIPDSADLDTPNRAELMGGAKNWQVENVAQAITLRAMMNVMGVDLGRQDDDTGAGTWRTDWAYPTFLAVLGESFRWCWVFDHTESVDPEPFEQRADRYHMALRVVGLRADVLKPGTDAAGLRSRVTHCIGVDQRPVLIEGLPDSRHIALITGYSSGGETLRGWSCSGGGPSILFDPERQAELRDWESRSTLALIPTGQEDRQAPKDVYASAIRRGATELRRNRWLRYDCGPAMYDAWVAALQDESLNANDEATVRRRKLLLDPPIWDLAERRHYAALFLRRGATLLDAPMLNDAAAECRAIHDLMYDILHTGGGNWPGEDMPRLDEPDIRRQITELILEAKDHDARAADLIEQAMTDQPASDGGP